MNDQPEPKEPSQIFNAAEKIIVQMIAWGFSSHGCNPEITWEDAEKLIASTIESAQSKPEPSQSAKEEAQIIRHAARQGGNKL